MPRYENGRFILNAKESQHFQNQLVSPDLEAARRRDAFLCEAEQMFSVQETDAGVLLSPLALSTDIPHITTIDSDSVYPVENTDPILLWYHRQPIPLDVHFSLREGVWMETQDFYSVQPSSALTYQESDFLDCA